MICSSSNSKATNAKGRKTETGGCRCFSAVCSKSELFADYARSWIPQLWYFSALNFEFLELNHLKRRSWTNFKLTSLNRKSMRWNLWERCWGWVAIHPLVVIKRVRKRRMPKWTLSASRLRNSITNWFREGGVLNMWGEYGLLFIHKVGNLTEL